MKFKIYTDGSCLGNPGAGGWAAVIVDEKNHREEIFGGEELTTNNRMELTAAIKALKKIAAGDGAELFTDSSYLKNAFNQSWLENWKRTNWKKNTVKNKDLWLELDELISTRAVKFNWVKGHAGNFLNERCDKLAHSTAEKFQHNAKRNAALDQISIVKKTDPAPSFEPIKNSSKPVQLSLFD